jgi:hypothetical protein
MFKKMGYEIISEGASKANRFLYQAEMFSEMK